MTWETSSAVNVYLEKVCAQIKCKEVHDDIRLEMQSHLEEMIEARMACGLPEEQAIAEALAAMGDPQEVGRQLHHVHKPRTEWSLILSMLAFLAIGLVVMYGLGVSHSAGEWDASTLVRDKTLAVIIGGMVGSVLFFGNYQKGQKYSLRLYMAVLLLLILTHLLGQRLNGLPMLEIPLLNWRINVGAYSAWLLLLAVAGLFATWNWSAPYAFRKALLLLFLPCVIYAKGYTLLYVTEYCIGFVILMLASKAPRTKAILSSLLLLGMTAWRLFAYPNQAFRLLAFLSPEKYVQTYGYQIVQSLQAVKQAGWWGRGLEAKLDMFPGIHTDFAFAYFVHSLGWAGGIALFLLAVFFTQRLYRIAGQIRDRYGSLLMTSIITLFAFEFFWNILMTLGLVPTMSIELPFISYGGTQTVLQMALLGLALNIYRRKDLIRSVAG
ncbi:MAG TPA: FtsW/RodA/SpoVE family cell cycle protein [Bacilli bacterium]|nr:FtsW/RodA/SpoVE family cell cycle protein [Bacilli bacterium]